MDAPLVTPPVNLLFVIYGLAPAGPELRILDFARTFPNRPDKFDVHVCVVGDDLTLLDEFQKARAKILHVPMRRSYAEWGNLKRVLDYISAHDIHVINSFNLKTLIVGAAAKLRFGRRVKLVHHLISLWDDVPKHYEPIIWSAARMADHIVCNGHAVRDHLIGSRRMTMPVSVIPNGVDCDYFSPSDDLRSAARASLGFTDRHFVLGTVGNVRPVKNYPFLLRMMAQLSKVVPHARLLCVGGGPQVEEVRALAASLDLGEQVVFTGSATDIRPFVAAMDAFSLCSIKEGNPNAVLQAMAMSLPVVSVSIGEVPYVIEHGTSGLLIDGHDEAAFVDAFSALAADPALRHSIGGAARRRVSERHSASQMIDSYASLMRTCSAGVTGRPGPRLGILHRA